MKRSEEISLLKEMNLNDLIIKMISIKGLNKKYRIKIFIACMNDHDNNTNTRFEVIDQLASKFNNYLVKHQKIS